MVIKQEPVEAPVEAPATDRRPDLPTLDLSDAAPPPPPPTIVPSGNDMPSTSSTASRGGRSPSKAKTALEQLLGDAFIVHEEGLPKSDMTLIEEEMRIYRSMEPLPMNEAILVILSSFKSILSTFSAITSERCKDAASGN